MPGSKKGKGSKGSASLKDSKSSASTVAKAGSVKGNKRKGKEAGLFEEPRRDSSFKIPKRSLPDTSVSSGGPSPRKTEKTKRPTKKSSKSKTGKGAQTQSGRGSATALPPTSTSQAPDHWANHRPGDGTIPPHAECVEWAGGLVLFRGTRHHPLLSFEAEHQAQRQTDQRLRLWRAELVQHERESLNSLRGVGGLVSPEPATLPQLPPWGAPNGWDYWGRPWAYVDAPSGHSEVGVSSTLSPPSSRVTVAVLVDCPHEPQFLPDTLVAQSAAIAAGRATRQARPITQKGEIAENMSLEAVARRLFPRTYGDGFSVTILEQLKAWESFWTLNIGRRKNPTMPTGDVTPRECPRAKLHGKAPETLSGRPTLTARAAGTASKSQASSTVMAPADQKLKQRPVVDLPRMEMPSSSPSQGGSQRSRTNTPAERAPPQVAATVPPNVDVDSQEVPSTSQGVGAGVAVRPKENGVSASHTQAQSSGQHECADQKAKQRATDQQGIRAMVAGVLERQGVDPEDWERSQGTNYRVDPLRPPEWVVRRPPGQHLATLEGVPEGEWRAEPDITPDELFRWLTQMAQGTSQACSYRSQELYF